jgi:preprotein translocase subunit YajC
MTQEDRMFVSPAYAQAAGEVGAGSLIANFLPLILIFGIMYMLLIRPQQKKMKQMKAMIDALRRGDQVLTGGGIVGKVTKVGDDGMIEVEIAEGVKVKVMKHTITQVMSKTEPAAA